MHSNCAFFFFFPRRVFDKEEGFGELLCLGRIRVMGQCNGTEVTPATESSVELGMKSGHWLSLLLFFLLLLNGMCKCNVFPHLHWEYSVILIVY